MGGWSSVKGESNGRAVGTLSLSHRRAITSVTILVVHESEAITVNLEFEEKDTLLLFISIKVYRIRHMDLGSVGRGDESFFLSSGTEGFLVFLYGD